MPPHSLLLPGQQQLCTTQPQPQPKCLNTGSYTQHTGAGLCSSARAFLTMLGSQYLPWEARQHPDLHPPFPEARAEPEQGEGTTKDRKQEH